MSGNNLILLGKRGPTMAAHFVGRKGCLVLVIVLDFALATLSSGHYSHLAWGASWGIILGYILGDHLIQPFRDSILSDCLGILSWEKSLCDFILGK